VGASIDSVVHLLETFSSNIEISRGKITLDSVRISGYSGCGKSTLIENFLQNNLVIASKSLHLSNNFDLPHFTVDEVISHNSLSIEVINGHLLALGMGVEYIENNYHKPLDEFSVGEKQRFSLAALVSSIGSAECKYVWIDEGLSGIQPELVMRIVSYLNNIGLGVILVHHGLVKEYEFGWEIIFK
jgi:ABC-type uncharacterized transport system ATPase component